jgi:hypothetical protein
MNPSADIPIVVDKILNKVREFKDNSLKHTKLMDELMKNPSIANKQEVKDKVTESGKIVQNLFQLIDELDAIEGRVKYDR